MTNDVLKAVKAHLEAAGIKPMVTLTGTGHYRIAVQLGDAVPFIDYRFERGGKHPILLARHGDAFVRYAIPSTGSDWRGGANCIAYLTRTLDLRPRRDKRNPTQRRVRCPMKRSQAPIAITSAPIAAPSKLTWQETLAAHFADARPVLPATR